MLVIFAVVVLMLAAAVVVLFAMMGELATRIPAPGWAGRDPTVRSFGEARLGAIPDYWPPGLAPANDDGHVVLVVLSTVCATCSDIAHQLSHDPGHGDWDELAVVVSTGSQRAGQDFITSHDLERFRCYVDTGGEWVSRQFGVGLSPSALVFREGRLHSAYLFFEVGALRAKIGQEPRDVSMQKESA